MHFFVSFCNNTTALLFEIFAAIRTICITSLAEKKDITRTKKFSSCTTNGINLKMSTTLWDKLHAYTYEIPSILKISATSENLHIYMYVNRKALSSYKQQNYFTSQTQQLPRLIFGVTVSVDIVDTINSSDGQNSILKIDFCFKIQNTISFCI